MRRADGAIFDMDGTLVDAPLDFGAIRSALDIAPGVGALEAIAAAPPERREAMASILLRHELAAAHAATLMPGAAAVVRTIRNAGLKTALLTRNARAVVAIIRAKFPDLEFDLARAREDGPVKPHADAVLSVCRALGIHPRRTACVGDFRYDLEAANAAGAISILFAPSDRPSYADLADHVVSDLATLPALLGIA